MKIADVRRTAFAMPLTNPAYPRGPYRFVNREFLIITYRTDPEALAKVVPEPLVVEEPLVKYEFIRMPDSTGFGDYTESGQVIPVTFNGVKGSYSHAMYLNDGAPILGGRELWGFPKKFARPSLSVETDCLVGVLDYGPVRIATGVMGFKHQTLNSEEVAKSHRRAELSSQDRAACRRIAAHSRTCRLQARRRRRERRVVRTGVPRSLSARIGACRRSARPRDRLSYAYHRRSHAGTWQGRFRLSRKVRFSDEA